MCLTSHCELNREDILQKHIGNAYEGHEAVPHVPGHEWFLSYSNLAAAALGESMTGKECITQWPLSVENEEGPRKSIELLRRCTHLKPLTLWI